VETPIPAKGESEMSAPAPAARRSASRRETPSEELLMPGGRLILFIRFLFFSTPHSIRRNGSEVPAQESDGKPAGGAQTDAQQHGYRQSPSEERGRHDQTRRKQLTASSLMAHQDRDPRFAAAARLNESARLRQRLKRDPGSDGPR
jgi:hypothetical protein